MMKEVYARNILALACFAATLSGCEETAQTNRETLGGAQAALANSLREDPTIPVVLHVLQGADGYHLSPSTWNLIINNINQNFANNNPNKANIPNTFRSHSAASNIRFKPAIQTPAGFTSPGIVPHPKVPVSELSDLILKVMDRWNPSSYLNVFVMDFSLLDAPTSPTFYNSALEAVFLDVNAYFEDVNYTYPHISSGLTREFGRFLLLKYLWGEKNQAEGWNANCQDDDDIYDTPRQKMPSNKAGEPIEFPFVAAGCPNSGINGVMFYNYMDYSNGNESMFTEEQVKSMDIAMITTRAILKESKGLLPGKCIPDAKESNDTAVSAHELAPLPAEEGDLHQFESVARGTLCDDDEDWYALTIPDFEQLDFITVNLYGELTDADVDLRFYNKNPNNPANPLAGIESANDLPTVSEKFTLLPENTDSDLIYFRVFSKDKEYGHYGPYTLDIRVYTKP